MSLDMEKELATVGRRIKELRQRRNLSQQDVADTIEMFASNYARIERGKINVTLGSLIKIANVFGVKLAVLFEPAAPTLPKKIPQRQRVPSQNIVRKSRRI